MRILLESGGYAFRLFLLLVLSSAAHTLGHDIEVVGYAENSKIENPHAFEGLQVTIECKSTETKGHFVTRGTGEVDQTGKFHINIPQEFVKGDGIIKQDCYAQLLSVSGNPCPAEDGLEASKIVLLSKSGEKHILGLKQNLKFSPEICVSKFFWHMPKYKFNLPPFPKLKKPCPPTIKFPPFVPIYKPPVVFPKKPFPPKIAYKPPVVFPKKPCPPKVPIFKPPVPIYKPPVVVPIYKPHVPIYKPHVPIYKPIYKPHVPIYKPHVPMYKPPVPIYKPIYKLRIPIYKPIYKPHVPIYKPHVPIYKPPVPIYKPIYKPRIPIYKPIYKPPVVFPEKPCPPLTKLPPFLPKYIPHPKFGKWPPLPSHP